MAKLPNIFLVGPTGAGKSTIGRYLAQELQLDFQDVDQVIENRTGADVAWIFDIEGEDGFRLREQKIIDELSSQGGIVLATGGGAVLSSENRNNLAARGVVVYLKASVAQQTERTKRDKKRPLLQNDDSVDILSKMKNTREPLYEEIADHVFDTNGRSVKMVGEAIIKKLKGEHQPNEDR